MRTYPFNLAPFLIALTLLIHAFVPILKQPAPPAFITASLTAGQR